MLHLKNYSIKIPKNVNLSLNNNVLIIKGPLGIKKILIQTNIYLNDTKTHIIVTSNLLEKLSSNKNNKNFQDVTFSFIKFLIYGVRFGFKKQLVIEGVGYKASLNNSHSVLNLKLGYSHLITVKIPLNIKVLCPKPSLIVISGICKQDVNNFAARIRKLRLPEPYKGKGIKYFDEIVIKKEGKRS